MTVNSCDRRVARTFRKPGILFGLAVILCGAPVLHAQQMPAYPYPQPNYQQPAVNPYAYPPQYQQPAYPQPVKPAQNAYYGNYQTNSIPGYVYPRNYTAMPAYSGNGVNYYYAQNPYAWNYTSPPAPSASNMPRSSSWPVAMRAPAATPAAPTLLDDPADD